MAENGNGKEIDPVCGERTPKYRVCHIPALNGGANEVHYEFTEHSYFTADSALAVCEKVGGVLPNLEEELNAIWLKNAMENLSSYVVVGWPFSLRWMTWPVSNI